ncbi:MAG: hypothetical protein KKI08_06030, partial [Armatimonadetes bacterium]|nr:hypothetical protein [Armatimonadota bacterium]
MPCRLCLVMLFLPALVAAQPRAVGLWSDPALAGLSSTPTADLTALLDRTDCQVETLSTADLSNPARLDPARLQCLLIPYAAFPAVAHGALMKFVQGGGGLILAEGDAFGQLLFPAGAGWARLDDFGAIQSRITGGVDWDLAQRDGPEPMSVSGEGTDAHPFVFATHPDSNYQYGGLKPPALTPQTAGLAFDVRGDEGTNLLCLEAQEDDRSRWKLIITVTPQWREVRVHLASFCSYATEKRGQPGDFLHPERLTRLFLGIFKGLVLPGDHRFEIRNVRF